MFGVVAAVAIYFRHELCIKIGICPTSDQNVVSVIGQRPDAKNMTLKNMPVNKLINLSSTNSRPKATE